MGVGRVAPRCLPVAARSRRPVERSVTGRGEFREGSREGSQRRWFDPSGRAPPRPACGLLGEFDSTPVPAKPPRFVMNVTSPRRRSSTASCARTSSRSSNAPDRRALRSPASSSGRSGPISSAGSSLTASCVFTATPAATIGSSRLHAKGVASVHPVAVDAWRIQPPISSIGSCPRCPSASGCSRFPLSETYISVVPKTQHILPTRSVTKATTRSRHPARLRRTITQRRTRRTARPSIRPATGNRSA